MRPHRRQPTRLPRPWDSPGKKTGADCHFLLQCMNVKIESEVAQSRPTLSDPMDCSLPGSSGHGIFQASVLEWGSKSHYRSKSASLEVTMENFTFWSCLFWEKKPLQNVNSPEWIIYSLLPNLSFEFQVTRLHHWLLSMAAAIFGLCDLFSHLSVTETLLLSLTNTTSVLPLSEFSIHIGDFPSMLISAYLELLLKH